MIGVCDDALGMGVPYHKIRKIALPNGAPALHTKKRCNVGRKQGHHLLDRDSSRPNAVGVEQLPPVLNACAAVGH
ncbi:hypothetical protein SDC9_81924 [bioreactor metagenome]|uniref:Uncharacterized protein n=1 Tax=bioreactor metagenome TaxID=1076179 RepID=A0A644ZBR4_9ZZZZ